VNETVSVVIAAHNEEPTIGPLVRGILQHTPGLVDVWVVDDGSSDRTSSEATAAGAQVLRLFPNRGKGAALRRGIEQSRGDVLVFLDADGQDDPAEIPLLMQALGDEVDLVIGSRFLGHFGPGAITRVNHAGNRFLTGILNVLYDTHVTDTQAGFKVVRRRAIAGRPLKASKFDIEVDVLANVLLGGGRVVEVPVSRAARAHGRSRLNSVRDGTLILKRIVQVRLGL
jgi:glycosyltransferase involved in cell wall biosynthesis